MKPPRQNVGKAGTKGTKPLPDGAGIAVRPFPIHLFNAAFDAPHDLGEILTPAQMAMKVPRGGRWNEMSLEAAADQALDALIGYGPQQPAPHSSTVCALEKGIRGLRNFALAGDKDAMNWLGYLLTQAVGDIAEMARRHPEIVREWSRKENVVPVLTGKNVAQTGSKKDVGQLRRDLDAFDVGAATPYQINPTVKRGGGTFNAATPVNALAAGLCARRATRHRAQTFAALCGEPGRVGVVAGGVLSLLSLLT